MAEGFYNSLTTGEHAKSAAGLEDKREKYKGKPHPAIIKVMKEVRIDISHQKIKLLTKKLVEEADKIIVFSDIKQCPAYLQNSDKVIVIKLDDPYKNVNDLQILRKSRDDVKKIVEKLLHG